MKKYATLMMLAAALGLAPVATADDEKKDRPGPGGDAPAERGKGRPERRPGGPEGDRPGPGQGQGRGMLEMMKNADSDGDKKISLDEWKAAASKRAEEAFKRIDGDKDGYITREDLEKMRERFGGGQRPEGRRPGRPEGGRPRDGGDDKAGGPRRPKRPEVE